MQHHHHRRRRRRRKDLQTFQISTRTIGNGNGNVGTVIITCEARASEPFGESNWKRRTKYFQPKKCLSVCLSVCLPVWSLFVVSAEIVSETMFVRRSTQEIRMLGKKVFFTGKQKNKIYLIRRKTTANTSVGFRLFLY